MYFFLTWKGYENLLLLFRNDYFGIYLLFNKFYIIFTKISLRNYRKGVKFMKILNPFIVSGYISPKYFCNRKQETEKLINDAINSSNTTLFSLRRMGKTGLIHHSINQIKKKEKIKCIYFDIMMTNNLQELVNEFGRAFLNQAMPFSKKLLNTAKNIFSAFVPVISTNPISGNLSFELKLARPEAVQYDLEKLLDYIKNSNVRYFIAIDEFQQIVYYPEKNIEALLRSKIQFMNNTSFIFSGSKKNMMLNMFDSKSRPFYQSTEFMELKPISIDIYNEFLIKIFAQYKYSIDSKLIEKIFDFSRGITYFVQLICNKLFALGEKIIDDKILSIVLRNLVAEKESYYINYSTLLTKKQFKILQAIAKESGIDKPTSSYFLNKYSLGSASTVASALEVLENKEALYKELGKYYVSDVLYSEWLKGIN